MACKETRLTHSEAETTAFRLQFHIRKQRLLERSAAAAHPLLFCLFGVPSEQRRFVHRPEEAARVISVSNGHTMGYFDTIKPVENGIGCKGKFVL
jgi:hypothetical protein